MGVQARHNGIETRADGPGVSPEQRTARPAGPTPRGPVLPRLDAGKLARHLPAIRPVRIEVNGVLAGAPLAVPDAVTEFAVGWAFAHRFFTSVDQLGAVTDQSSHISLMVESGADLERCKYEAIGWIGAIDGANPPDASIRPPRSIAVMSELDAIATCQRSFERFERDGARAGYVHAALASADDIHCIARDVTTDAAASKVIGWALTNGTDWAATMLVVRGVVGYRLVDAAARAGIPIVATDAVPTAEAIATAEAVCTSILGLALAHRRGLFADGGHLGDDPHRPHLLEMDS